MAIPKRARETTMRSISARTHQLVSEPLRFSTAVCSSDPQVHHHQRGYHHQQIHLQWQHPSDLKQVNLHHPKFPQEFIQDSRFGNPPRTQDFPQPSFHHWKTLSDPSQSRKISPTISDYKQRSDPIFTANSQIRSEFTTALNFEAKRLNPTEILEREKKGLCFLCDDKFEKGHVCHLRSDSRTSSHGVEYQHRVESESLSMNPQQAEVILPTDQDPWSKHEDDDLEAEIASRSWEEEIKSEVIQVVEDAVEDEETWEEDIGSESRDDLEGETAVEDKETHGIYHQNHIDHHQQHQQIADYSQDARLQENQSFEPRFVHRPFEQPQHHFGPRNQVPAFCKEVQTSVIKHMKHQVYLDEVSDYDGIIKGRPFKKNPTNSSFVNPLNLRPPPEPPPKLRDNSTQFTRHEGDHTELVQREAKLQALTKQEEHYIKQLVGEFSVGTKKEKWQLPTKPHLQRRSITTTMISTMLICREGNSSSRTEEEEEPRRPWRRRLKGCRSSMLRRSRVAISPWRRLRTPGFLLAAATTNLKGLLAPSGRGRRIVGKHWKRVKKFRARSRDAIDFGLDGVDGGQSSPFLIFALLLMLSDMERYEGFNEETYNTTIGLYGTQKQAALSLGRQSQQLNKNIQKPIRKFCAAQTHIQNKRRNKNEAKPYSSGRPNKQRRREAGNINSESTNAWKLTNATLATPHQRRPGS